MTVHLIKLCVGPETLSDLVGWQQHRLNLLRATREVPELVHVTRNFPKREADVLDGGSIYWVIKGWVVARQRLLELRRLQSDGVAYCGLVCDHELVRVVPRKHRAFQGWRYLDPNDAPRDLAKGSDEANLPEDMRRDLAELGLL